jgi:uncharacterized protein YrrD
VKSSTIISLEKELKGMSLLSTATGAKLGEVIDVIVDPIKGSVLGIAIHTKNGNRQMLATRDFFIGADAVMASADYRFEDHFVGFLENGLLALKELVGTTVITDDGRALGRLSEIYLSRLRPHVFYRITESTLQRFIGGGFYIPGDIVKAYPSDDRRMIVSGGLIDRFAFSSLPELSSFEESESHGRKKVV